MKEKVLCVWIVMPQGALEYRTQYKVYRIWANSLFVSDNDSPSNTLVGFSHKDYFLDKRQPTSEEIVLWEMEMGIPFPPLGMYTRYMESK